MTRLLTLAVLTCLLAPAAAQDDPAREVQALLLEGHDRLAKANTLKRQADKDSDAAKRSQADALYDQACAAYARALKVLPQVEGAPPAAVTEVRRIVHYNTCCARAGQGRRGEALDALAKALEAGYDDFTRIAEDADLDPLRSEPRFVQLIERVQAALAKQAREAGNRNLSKEALFAYDLKIETLAGETFSLKAMRGKVVIIDYWGTWCPPCRQEIPHFVKLKEEFGDRLEILGMTWERGKSGDEVVAAVKRFAEKLGINYHLALVTDQRLISGKVPNFKGYPTTLFFDKQGRVRAKEVGYRDYGTLHEMLHALDDEGTERATDPDHEDAPPAEEEQPAPEQPERRRQF